MATVDPHQNVPTPEPAEAPAPPAVVGFEQVFEGECHDIELRRRRTLGSCTYPRLTTTGPTVANGFAGLALSGGGIRSAAFSLGALQALGSQDLIKRFDYLSTVSGGGYIGTTLSIGLSEGAGFPFGRGSTEAGETPITRHIRDHARYLIPNGFRSVVTALVVYLRGIAMNVLVVLPFMLGMAAILVFFNPTTDDLDRAAWPGKILGILPESFSWSLTIISLIIGSIIWTFYALVASMRPPPDWIQHRFTTSKFAVVFLVLLIPPLIEGHVLLLKVLKAWADAPTSNDTFTMVFDWLTRLMAVVAPIVALPFVRGIAEQAVTEATGTWGNFFKTVASRASLLLLATAAPAILWLCTMHLARWATLDVIQGWPAAPGALRAAFARVRTGLGPDWWCFAAFLTYATTSLLLVASWRLFSVNANSLHQLYRDRLGRTFLVKEQSLSGSSASEPDVAFTDDHKLSKLAPDRGPYHLINAALNVPGSTYANRRGRNADFFVFSRRYIGSDLTGYVPTPCAEEAVYRLTTGTAMAISGAAAAPNMGMASVQPLSPTIALFNVRLGRWLLHPCAIAAVAQAKSRLESQGRPAAPKKRTSYGEKPNAKYLLREAFSKSGRGIGKVTDPSAVTKHKFVFLTDGGHIENLGIYELLKRRCRVIVAIDGEADPDLRAASLTQVERFARIDLGTRIVMDWSTIAACTRDTSQRVRDRTIRAEKGPHVALGLIDYPPARDGEPREVGVLVYVKASLSGDEASYVMAYKARNPSFPHESTADQFFSEEQFEVYRALGEHIMKRFLESSDAVSLHPANRTDLLTIVKQELRLV